MLLHREQHAPTVASQSSNDIFQYREHGKALENGAASDISPTSIMSCLDIARAIARRIQE